MIRPVLFTAVLCGATIARADDAAPAAPKPVEKKQETQAILPVPDYSGDIWSRSTMTGDWNGKRQEMAENGIFFRLGLTQIYQRIGHGGKESIDRDPRFARSPFKTIPLSADHAGYSGSLDFTFDVDTGRAHLWQGALFHVRAQSRWGSPLNDDAGTVSPVNADAVFPSSTNNSQAALTAMSLTQFFSEHFGVTLGRYDTTEGDPDPFMSDETDTFENMSFTQPMTALRTIPQTALGGGVVWLPEKNTMVTALALDSEGQTNTSGFDTIWHNGTTLLAQAQHENMTGDLPGGQRLGVSWSNKDYTSLDQDSRLPFLGFAVLGRPPKNGTDSWSVFGDVWQYVETWEGKKDKGWGVFARIGYGDPATNPITEAYTLGVGGQGGLLCRKDDSWGVGGYYLGLSSELNVRHITSEKGLEAYYSIGITPWMHLTPSVQFVDPFVREFSTTLIGGIRLQIDF